MPSRLFSLYQRKRIININANIIASGLLSTFVVMGLLAMLKHIVGTSWPTWGYTGFSLVADLILDVAIFAALHWVANHWRPLKPKCELEHAELHAPAPDILSDTAHLQLERAVISPLYYLIAVLGTEWLQREGLPPYWAVAIAYPAGLVVTRTLHTIWGLRSGTFTDHHKRDNGDSPK